MNDFGQFEQLIQRGYGCISIVTHEERYALEIIRKTALKLKRDMWVWSLAGGVRDGNLEGSPYIPDTESPAAGIAGFEKAKSGSLCVALDLAEHLKGGRCLRLLRDMINSFDKTNITLILLDYVDQLPEAIKSHSQLFELSYPDEQELRDTIKATLMLLHRKNAIESA